MEKGTSVVRKLQNAGYIAYFAGGCVRDMLLNITPKDVDIATSARPEQVQALFPRTIGIGAHFGVVQVRYGGEGFEVATFREDGTYQDGRRPDSVIFADAEADVLRRDFTINGLLWDPLTEQLFDYVGGQSDLRDGRIRAIGEPLRRFEEDRLRMLRAIRFSTRFSFPIEEETWNAIQTFSSSLLTVSAERIREEVFKTLGHANRALGLQLLFDSTFLHAIFPSTWIRNEEQLHQLLQSLPTTDSIVPIQLIFLLLHTESSSALDEWGRKWTLSNKERTLLVHINEDIERVSNLECTDLPGVKRLVRRPSWAYSCGVLEILRVLHPERYPSFPLFRDWAKEWGPETLHPKPLLTGRDLSQMGLQPGPLFKKLLFDLESEQLAGGLSTREEAEALVHSWTAPPSPES